MIKIYEEQYEKQWDNLVLNESSNGNFLQTRRFLNYHKKGKFIDHSLMFFKGEQLVAVIPANLEDDGKSLISHSGSTYGGMIIGQNFCSTSNYKWMFKEMMNHFREEGYNYVEIRTSNWLYKRNDNINELLDYYFQLNGFFNRKEVGFFINLANIDENYETNYDSLKKRKLKIAGKYNLSFKELTTIEGIKEFYDVLANNMCKFGIVPVHTCEELIDFKFSRLRDEVFFYGVFYEEHMIAGSMVFNFCSKKVFHTQYLCSRQDCLKLCPNEYLYTKLIKTAKDNGYRFLSFGTSTLEHGKVYNDSLGMYKEGFNTDSYVNTCYFLDGTK